MKKKIIIRLLLIIFIPAILIALVIISKQNEQVHYNKKDYIGNTAGNLYNGGTFCEQGGRVYFSNFNDDGTLYSMDLECNNVMKINDDKARYINVDENYIYYSRENNTKVKPTKSIFLFYCSGIYRIDKNNGNNTLQLYGEPSGLLSLYGNTIYYQHYSAKIGIQFYSVDIDKKNETRLSDSPILPASYHEGSMYFAGADVDHSIYAMNTKDNTVKSILNSNCYMPIARPEGIYYISLEDNYALCRIDYEGNNKTVLIDEFCSTYNISIDGNYIFYQVDGGDNNHLGQINLTTMEKKVVLDGDYKQIGCTSNFVFFRDYNGVDVYAYKPQNGELRLFQPPVIK
ncbi:DUF5050 domain-containing protein [Lachnoclostridium phytofermentans]|uniref:Prolow-density lipoprotein receptor-related protein 1-like beta-propeller domain-containing protein n=1 Tax=Lachnoclostridium phytofermentans (strain ATCC 700394 / DSM 18823 / ISDg) TaxID=357809 RepID=A9KP59_LACP7|nr:DUF5050 domain-containing protein [Lachnoclostridium phytofermentans]ABX41721.1 hypothetical protein Cphy_1344 [Lachnoclostridium phytofermentans ISDg]